MEKQIFKYFTVFLLNCETNNLQDCGLFCIAIGRAYFLFIVLPVASKILHVNSYHRGRNLFVQEVFFICMYTYTHRHMFVIYLQLTDEDCHIYY